MAHSKGPWEWVQESVGRRVWRLVSATGRAIFWPVPDREAASISEMRSTEINCPIEADRVLLAAAPELLEALKRRLRGDKCRCFLVNDRNCTFCLDTQLVARIESQQPPGSGGKEG